MRANAYATTVWNSGLGDLLTAQREQIPSGRVVPSSDGRGIRIVHTEFLGDVRATTSQFEHIVRLDVNPGLHTTFPRLSAFARWYSQYRFNFLAFHFKPLIPDVSKRAVGTATIALAGQLNDRNYDSRREAEATNHAIGGTITQHLICGVPSPDLYGQPGGQRSQWRYCAYEYTNDTHDKFQTCIASVQLMTENVVPGIVVGEFYAHYDVELIMPSNRIPPNMSDKATLDIILRRLSQIEGDLSKSKLSLLGDPYIQISPDSQNNPNAFTIRFDDVALKQTDSDLRSAIDLLHADLNRLSTDVTAAEIDIADLVTTTTDLATITASLDTRTKANEVTIESHTLTIASHISRLGDLETANVANTDDHRTFAQNIATLDTTATLHASRIADLETASTANIDDHRTFVQNITTLDSATSAHAVRLADLEAASAENVTDHAKFTHDITTLQSTTSVHGVRIADLEVANVTNTTDHAQFTHDITTLQSTTSVHGARLGDLEGANVTNTSDHARFTYDITTLMSSSLDHANRIVDLETSRIEHKDIHFTLDDKIAALERTTTTHGLNIADLEQATTTNTNDHASFASAIQTLDGTATFHGLRLNDVELKANTHDLALPGKLDEIESASGVLSVTVDTDRPDKRKIARVELDTTTLLAPAQSSIVALESATVNHGSRLVTLETSNTALQAEITTLDARKVSISAYNALSTNLQNADAALQTQITDLQSNKAAQAALQQLSTDTAQQLEATRSFLQMQITDLEKYKATKATVTQLTTDTAQQIQQLKNADAAIQSVNNTHESRLDSHAGRLDDITPRIAAVETEKIDALESLSSVLRVTHDTERADKRKIARVELDTVSLLATTQTSIAALETAKVDHSSRLDALETSNTAHEARLTSLDTVVPTKIDTLSTDTTLVTTVTTNPATQEKAVAVSVNTTQVALKSDIPFPLSDATYNFLGRTYGLYCCVNVNNRDFQIPNFGVMLCHLTNDLCHVMMSGNFTLSDPAVNANSNVRIYLPFEIVNTIQLNHRGPTVAQRTTGKVHGSVQGNGPVIDCATISSYSNRHFMRLYLQHSPQNGQQFLLGSHIYNKTVDIQELSIWFKPRYPLVPIPQCLTAI